MCVPVEPVDPQRELVPVFSHASPIGGGKLSPPSLIMRGVTPCWILSWCPVAPQDGLVIAAAPYETGIGLDGRVVSDLRPGLSTAMLVRGEMPESATVIGHAVGLDIATVDIGQIRHPAPPEMFREPLCSGRYTLRYFNSVTWGEQDQRRISGFISKLPGYDRVLQRGLASSQQLREASDHGCLPDDYCWWAESNVDHAEILEVYQAAA